MGVGSGSAGDRIGLEGIDCYGGRDGARSGGGDVGLGAVVGHAVAHAKIALEDDHVWDEIIDAHLTGANTLHSSIIIPELLLLQLPPESVWSLP